MSDVRRSLPLVRHDEDAKHEKATTVGHDDADADAAPATMNVKYKNRWWRYARRKPGLGHGKVPERPTAPPARAPPIKVLVWLPPRQEPEAKRNVKWRPTHVPPAPLTCPRTPSGSP